MSVFCNIGATSIPFDLWRPGLHLPGPLIALDTETELIQPGETPRAVIGTASDGRQGVFIAVQHFGSFLDAHPDCIFLLHNAAFDMAVLNHAGVNTAPLVESGRIFDTGLLYRLLKLADTGSCHGRWGLDTLSGELLKTELPKDERSADGQDIRTTFARFLKPDGTPDYPAMLAEKHRPYLTYAGRDAVATVMVAEHLEAWARRVFGAPTLSMFDPATFDAVGVHDGINLAAAWKQHGFLTHHIQLKASIALAAIERAGMYVDGGRVKVAVDELDAGVKQVAAALKALGWEAGKGSALSLQTLLAHEEKVLKAHFARTDTNLYSACADDLEEFRAESKFIDLLLRYKDLTKLRNTFMAPLAGKVTVVRGHFNVLVNGGRTSCTGKSDDPDGGGMNLQTLPREGPVRESLCAGPGTLLLACDYSTIELVTLAQHTLTVFGHSQMAEAIKKGADLHCVYAAHRLGIDLSNLPSWNKRTLLPLLGADGDKLRDKAKPANFGYPGGLGAATFVEFARASYGVNLTIDEAKKEKEDWLNAWPEMKQFLTSDDLQRLASNFPELWATHPNVTQPLNPTQLPWPVYILQGIVCGRTATKTSNRSYSAAEIDWAWQAAAQIAQHLPHLSDTQRGVITTRVRERIAGNDLWSQLVPRQRFVVTQTGRPRGYPTYCAGKNAVFQGLAADGAKLALYRLHREGFRIVNFIHDEVLIEFPVEADHRVLAEQVKSIMVAEMQRVVPDLPVECEYALMRRWYKGAKTLIENGKLLPVRPVHEPEIGKVRWEHDQG